MPRNESRPNNRNPLYTGDSQIGLRKRPFDPEYVQRLDEEDDVHESEDLYLALVSDVEPGFAADARAFMGGLRPRRPGCADKEGKFRLRDLSKPTSPILAHDIPSVPGNILHISDLNHPSLAVGNMLQLNLGNHQNWET